MNSNRYETSFRLTISSTTLPINKNFSVKLTFTSSKSTIKKTRKRCETCSKLTINTLFSNVYIADFEQVNVSLEDKEKKSKKKFLNKKADSLPLWRRWRWIS